MYKWSLLLLASFAVFQPIASFTEHNLVDGRQQCCDHQPHLLHRDSRLDVYGTYRHNKLASEDRRLNNHREIPETRRYEVRSVESTLSRETETAHSRVVSDRTARFSRLDRWAVSRIEPHDQRNRRVSHDRFSLQNDREYRESRIRYSRDDTTRVADERRSRISMEGRREQRLHRETNSDRYNRAAGENRDLLQRTRNDLVRADMRHKTVSRMADVDRRSYIATTESKRQNVRNNNRYFSLERRVRDISESRLSLARARSAEETRRITKDDRDIRNNLNRRLTRQMFETERRIQHTPESRRITDDARVARFTNVRDQTREDFRKERRAANPERRLTRTAVREERSRSTVPSEERESRRIRVDIRESRGNARDNRRNTIDVHHNVRSDERFNIRGNDGERRITARSLERRATRASDYRSSLLSREEPNNMIRKNLRLSRNIREREIRDAGRQERRSLNRETREDRRTILENIRSEDRVLARRETRTSRPLDARSRNIEEQSARVMEADRRSRSLPSARIDERRSSQNDERERQIERRRLSTDRRMERSRRESREDTLARQARSVENVKAERRDTRSDRVDARNRRLSRVDGRFDAVVRESRKSEKDASRTRDIRINDKPNQAVRESRNKEVRSIRARDMGDIRSRFAFEEAARYRHDFVSKKATDETPYAMNWQYLFYTLQGLYLCSALMTMVKETPDKKTRSWWASSKAIKVD